jgi:hypothetical protein
MLTGQSEFPHRATQFQAAPKTIQQFLTIFAELLRGNVRVGSKAEKLTMSICFRVTPDSGHGQQRL